MRVRLIPTGRCELLGLSACLSRLFPGHTFETVHERQEPDGARVPFDGFTSSRLRDSVLPGNLEKLVEQLASEVYPGRDGVPADLAILLDDLEIENADQAGAVVSTVQTAVRRHVAGFAQRRSAETARRLEQALRARASFHLAVPMIEAWFFADPGVLPAAGVPLDRLPPRLRADVDPEAFETDDAAFSEDDGAGCEALRAGNALRRKPERPRWVLSPREDVPWYRRERHPKAYLAWLCRDHRHKRCSTYTESEHGAAALSALDWQGVLGAPAYCTFARALVQDLGDALGPPAMALPDGVEHPLVSRSSHGRTTRVLRNL